MSSRHGYSRNDRVIDALTANDGSTSYVSINDTAQNTSAWYFAFLIPMSWTIFIIYIEDWVDRHRIHIGINVSGALSDILQVSIIMIGPSGNAVRREIILQNFLPFVKKLREDVESEIVAET